MQWTDPGLRITDKSQLSISSIHVCIRS